MIRLLAGSAWIAAFSVTLAACGSGGRGGNSTLDGGRDLGSELGGGSGEGGRFSSSGGMGGLGGGPDAGDDGGMHASPGGNGGVAGALAEDVGGTGSGGAHATAGSGGGAGAGAGSAGSAAQGGAGTGGGAAPGGAAGQAAGGATGSGGGVVASGCDSVCNSGEVCTKGICRGTSTRWTTLGGDVHHSGFNANETGTPPLSPAWTVALASKGGLWPVVSDGTRLYVTEDSYFDPLTRMWALDPADGHTLWKYDFGNVHGLSQPTVDRGHVYVAQCNHSPGTYMYSFVAAAGTLLWSMPFGAQWESYWAPLVTPDGNLYFNGGSYGGLYGLRASNGAQLFFNSSLPQWDAWSPMFLGGQVYTFIAGNLRVHDLLTNAVLQTVAVQIPWKGIPYSMNAAPVSDGDKIYLVAPPNLLAYLPGKATPEWSAAGAYTGMPAVANGVVYTVSAGQLRANDAATGNTLWTFAGDSALSFPPAVAGRFVYVSSSANAYAIDATTQQMVWTTSPGGWISIAGGRIFVAQANGTLAAHNLTPGPR